MKCLVLLILSAGFCSLHAQSTLVSLDLVRSKLAQASNSSDAADELSGLLESITEQHPLHFGYKGMADFLQAKYSFNPLSKVKYFNRGREKLDRAIALLPKNVELRFLRFAVQDKAPSILGYHDHLDEDKQYLLRFIDEQRNNLSEKELLHRIVMFLKTCDTCSESERKRMVNIE